MKNSYFKVKFEKVGGSLKGMSIRIGSHYSVPRKIIISPLNFFFYLSLRQTR